MSYINVSNVLKILELKDVYRSVAQAWKAAKDADLTANEDEVREVLLKLLCEIEARQRLEELTMETPN